MVYVDYTTRNYLEQTGGAAGIRDYSNYDKEIDTRRALNENSTLDEFL